MTSASSARPDRLPRRVAITRGAAAIAAILLGFAAALTAGTTAAAAPVLENGDTVYVGDEYYITGSAFIFPVWNQTPADLANPGVPDYWGYCIEQTVSSVDEVTGTVGDIASFLGGNFFATNPDIPGQVLWVLAHSYPSLSVAELAVAANIPGLTLVEAISGTTTAIWRLTDIDYDANYYWEGPNAEALFHYLVDGAQASTGMSPADFATTVSVTPPAAAQTADSLIGPFVVATDKPTATVSVTAPYTLTDATGTAIDPAAVVDGQELYVDARGVTSAGSATVTASVPGSSATGKILSLSYDGDAPTSNDHAQTLILVAAGDATTEASATAAWAAVAGVGGGTQDDEDVLAATGGEPSPALLAVGVLFVVTGALVLAHPRRGRVPAHRY